MSPGRGEGLGDVPYLKLVGDIDPNDGAAPSMLPACRHALATSLMLVMRLKRTALGARGFAPLAVSQGNVGDCWLLSGISALAEVPTGARALH